MALTAGAAKARFSMRGRPDLLRDVGARCKIPRGHLQAECSHYRAPTPVAVLRLLLCWRHVNFFRSIRVDRMDDLAVVAHSHPPVLLLPWRLQATGNAQDVPG